MHNINNYQKILFIVLLAIILSLFLRGDSPIRGTDTAAYIDFFDRIVDYESLRNIYYMDDYGFSHLSYVIKSISIDSRTYLILLFFISTVTIFSSYYIFLKGESSSIFYLAIVLLLFSSSFYLLNINALRQGISLSFLLMAYSFLFNRRNALAVIFLLVAFLFHKSAIFGFIVFFLIFLRYWQGLSLVSFYYCASITGLLINIEVIFHILNMFGFSNISEKLNTLSKETTGTTTVEFKMLVLFILVHYFAWLRMYTNNRLFLFITCIYILTAGLVMLFSSFESFTNRSLLFFGIVEPIIFALSIHCFKKKNEILGIVFLGGMAYFLYVLFHPSFRSELLISMYAI